MYIDHASVMIFSNVYAIEREEYIGKSDSLGSCGRMLFPSAHHPAWL
jgi:hypothetical protein